MSTLSAPYSTGIVRRLALSILAGVAFLLSACASTGTDVQGFDQVTLAPGDTGNCTSSPCQVSLQIPAGQGSYVVTANEVKVGTYPAGQTANLGGFWQSQAFQIQGMNVPKAYAYMPNKR